MAEATPGGDDNPVGAWIRSTLDAAVKEITHHGVFAGELVEARPIWSLPERVMIGQIRDADSPETFRWLICGDVPTDHVPADVAATARDALRHFSLKWQLGAARIDDPATRQLVGLGENESGKAAAAELAATAEELYALAAEDRLWPDPDDA